MKFTISKCIVQCQMHECVGTAVRAMGPEALFSILPFNLDAKDLSNVNVWLLPILRQYIVGAHLSYFTNSILDWVEHVRQICKKVVARSEMYLLLVCLNYTFIIIASCFLQLEREGKIVSAKSVEGLVYSLWSLLPAFCNYPLDTAANFPDLREKLCVALLEEPDLRGIICFSLQVFSLISSFFRCNFFIFTD